MKPAGKDCDNTTEKAQENSQGDANVESPALQEQERQHGQAKLMKLGVIRKSLPGATFCRRHISQQQPHQRNSNRGRRKRAKLSFRRKLLLSNVVTTTQEQQRSNRGQQKLAKLVASLRIQQRTGRAVLSASTPQPQESSRRERQHVSLKFLPTSRKSERKKATSSAAPPILENDEAYEEGLQGDERQESNSNLISTPVINDNHSESDSERSAVDVETGELPSEDQDEQDEDGQRFIQTQSRVEERLSVANLVIEPDLPIAEIEIDDPLERERMRKMKQEKAQRRMVLVGTGSVMIVTAIILGFVFGLRDNAPRSSEANAFSNVPTAAPTVDRHPTVAPTVSPETYLINLLPDDTWQTVQYDLDRTSPQSRAYDWITSNLTWLTKYATPSLDWRIKQRFALATFYFATGGSSKWKDDQGWLDHSLHECLWGHRPTMFLPVDASAVEFTYEGWGGYSGNPFLEGRVFDSDYWNGYITNNSYPNPCGEADLKYIHHGRYQHLWLWANGLNGTIPPEIFWLTSLKSISLGGQGLTQFLPTEIGLCTDLEVVSLMENRMTGEVPSQVGQLSKLKFLHLPGNDFNSTVPLDLWELSSMTALDMRLNGISGTLPTSIGLLTSLQYWDFARTYVQGQLPTEIGLMTSLTNLDLEYCEIGTTLPSELGNLKDLRTLILRENFWVNGTLPTEIGQMTALEILDLAENFALTGVIPTEIGSLSNLIGLDISETYLTSSLPSEIGLMTSLSRVVVFYSELSGQLPSEVGLLTGLTDFVANDNNFTGIPSELGKLSGLTNLVLNENRITGTLPTFLALMSELPALYLQGNQIQGRLPMEFQTMTALTGIYLSENLLTGEVDDYLRPQMPWLKDLALSSNLIKGSLPSTLGLLTSLRSLELAENQIEGLFPTELGLLEGLVNLDLGGNLGFTGTIVTELGRVSNLTGLGLSGGFLSGRLPSELGLLSQMFHMDVTFNQLTGRLPSEIFSLLQVDRIHLSHNLFTGSIPSEAGLLDHFMSELKIGDCFLTGAIPLEIWFSEINELHLPSNYLTGSLATEIGLSGLQYLDVRNNQMSGTIPTEVGLLYWFYDGLLLSGNNFTGQMPDLQ